MTPQSNIIKSQAIRVEQFYFNEQRLNLRINRFVLENKFLICLLIQRVSANFNMATLSVGVNKIRSVRPLTVISITVNLIRTSVILWRNVNRKTSIRDVSTPKRWCFYCIFASFVSADIGSFFAKNDVFTAQWTMCIVQYTVVSRPKKADIIQQHMLCRAILVHLAQWRCLHDIALYKFPILFYS